MKFAEFQELRTRLLRERKALIDCAETNLYAALAHLIPAPTVAPEYTVHRCHLATEWTAFFALPPDTSGRALISGGVRDSLALLFRHYASEGAKVWLPTDNYPVYGELARKAGLAPGEFVTLPEPRWPDATGVSSPEILVVTNPLKPLGRWLSSAEISALLQWLKGSPTRRIILDTVYTFDVRFHPTTLALLETPQTILLHSLTKGWLHPRLFGIALVPEQDAEALTSVFRANPPSQSSLARARVLMGQHTALPTTIGAVLKSARGGLISRLEAKLPLLNRSEGYFLPLQGRWSELLDEVGVLGLPASVFGSAREDLTILSSLGSAS